jgi:hypothetical protein
MNLTYMKLLCAYFDGLTCDYVYTVHRVSKEVSFFFAERTLECVCMRAYVNVTAMIVRDNGACVEATSYNLPHQVAKYDKTRIEFLGECMHARMYICN